MKITNKDFMLFQAEVKRLMRVYGLSGWQVYFKQDDILSYGEVKTSALDRVVTFTFPKTIERGAESDYNPLKTAKHEVCHLLLAPLSDLAYTRFTSENEIYAAEEDIVNKLASILDADLMAM
jgi:hypothetical protein